LIVFIVLSVFSELLDIALDNSSSEEQEGKALKPNLG